MPDWSTTPIPCNSDHYYTGNHGRRIIFQTWKNNDVPDHWKPSVDSIFENMPGWEYRLMTDEDNENFIKQYFPDFLEVYQKFPYNIQRADAIRYCVMAKAAEAFGENIEVIVYMDLDFVVRMPLDPIFDVEKAEAYFVPSGNVMQTLTNSFMAGRPGAKVFYECVQEMQDNGLNPKWYIHGKHMIVMNSTGPIMLNRIANMGKSTYLKVPPKLFMPCSACNLDCDIPEDAYLRPLEGGSWNGWDSKFYNMCMCHYDTLAPVILLIIILVILLLLYFFVYRRRY